MWNIGGWNIVLLSATLLALREASGHNLAPEETLAVVREMKLSSKRSMEASHPDLLTLHVTPDDHVTDPFPLALTRTRSKVQPDDVTLVLDEPIADDLQARENREFKASNAKNTAFYSNHEHTAVLSVTQEVDDEGKYKRTLFGTLILNGKTYEIRPYRNADVHALESRGLDPDQGHMLHSMRKVTLPVGPHDDLKRDSGTREKATERETSSKGAEYLNILQGLHDDEATLKRKRRQAGGPGSEPVYNVELTFLLDYYIYDYWIWRSSRSEQALEGIHEYYAHIFHGMYLAYLEIYLAHDVAISLWLKEIHVATTPGASSYVSYGSDGGEYFVYYEDTFDGIKSYMDSNSLNWLNTDHIMFWSRYSFEARGILGVSRVICGVCETDNSMTVNHDYGLFSYRTGAHELGHNLGAHHDGGRTDCPADDEYLMTPTAMLLTTSTSYNSFRFSECSVAMMRDCITGNTHTYDDYGYGPSWLPAHNFPRTCVMDAPEDCEHEHSFEDTLETLPGEMFDLDEQCQLATGDESAHFDQTCQQQSESESICKQLWCVTSDSPRCDHVIAEMNAEAGTSCGFESRVGNVCWRGNCVAPDSFNYTHGSFMLSCNDSDEIIIPLGCNDVASLSTCLAVVFEEPWRCFGNMQYACAYTCTDYGLFTENDHPCDAEPYDNTQNTWLYELCGYDMWDGYHVKCPNHDMCMPMWWVGDGYEDCPDNADEDPEFVANVPSGFLDYVRCPSDIYKLIPGDYMCDEYDDCPEGGDEYTENCDDVIPYCDAYEHFEMNCPNDPTVCIPLDWLCDGFYDCGNGYNATDEDPYLCDVMEPYPADCENDTFACPVGRILGRACIELWEMCDGFNDCYSTDEDYSVDEDPDFCDDIPPATCAGNEFTCPEWPYICLPDWYLCDDWQDCYETNYDESDSTCGLFDKRDNKQIPKNHDESEKRAQLCTGSEGTLEICEQNGVGRHTLTTEMAQAKIAAHETMKKKVTSRNKRTKLLEKSKYSKRRGMSNDIFYG